MFYDELVTFRDLLFGGWEPPRSSCGQCSPTIAADRDSSHGTPDKYKQLFLLRLSLMPSFAKGGNKRLFNNKIIGIYIFFNIFNICVLYIHCTHSEYMWGGES